MTSLKKVTSTIRLATFSGTKTNHRVMSFGLSLPDFMDFYSFLRKQGYDEQQAHQRAGEYQRFLIERGQEPAAGSISQAHEQNEALRPMPTHGELEAAGSLYSQAYGAGRTKNIIQHLQAVWMPWIEAGVLTQPELNKPDRDPSAYKALAAWRLRPGNDLKTALGHNIPSKSDLVDGQLDAAALLPPGDRPARLGWAVRRRAQREKAVER